MRLDISCTWGIPRSFPEQLGCCVISCGICSNGLLSDADGIVLFFSRLRALLQYMFSSIVMLSPYTLFLSVGVCVRRRLWCGEVKCLFTHCRVGGTLARSGNVPWRIRRQEGLLEGGFQLGDTYFFSLFFLSFFFACSKCTAGQHYTCVQTPWPYIRHWLKASK